MAEERTDGAGDRGSSRSSGAANVGLAMVAALFSVLAAGCQPVAEDVGQPASAAVDIMAPSMETTGSEPSPAELNAGEAVERRIAAAGVHEYRLRLSAGEFFSVEVEQRGVDVALSLFDSQGALVRKTDLPIADLGPERFLGIADQSAEYRLEVRASQDSGGSYLARVETLLPAGEVERLRARASGIFFEGEKFTWSRRFEQAKQRYEEALELWRRAGDGFWQALTMDRIGATFRRLGEWRRAVEFHQRAADLFADLGETRFASLSLYQVGSNSFNLGDMSQAIVKHRRSIELRRGVGDRRGEGLGLVALGDIFKIQGETQMALDHFSAAQQLLDREEDRRYRGVCLHNLGTLYRQLGKRQVALEQLQAAERIFAELSDTRRRASSVSQIGQLTFELGDPERALTILGTALELRRQGKDLRGQAVVLRHLGTVLLNSGDATGAERHYLQALDLLRESENPRSEAAVLASLGNLYNETGRTGEALEHLDAALEIFRRVGDPVGQASGLLGVAVAERQLGRLESARAAGEEALEIAETLRIKPLSEDLRFSFFSTAQHIFDFYIDLLMELDRERPDAGYGLLALQASERARARSLLDLLSEAGAEIRDDAAPQLLEQERAMQKLLNESVELVEDGVARERERAARDMRRALQQLETVRAAIRQQSPRYAALTQPRPLSVAEIRRQVLDRDTVAMEYRLGEERSFLWLITQDSFNSFELAPAAEIERAVREAHALLMQGPRRESRGRTRALLCEIRRLLLDPVAGRLGNKRLAIVADGALEYLSFAALPDPDSAQECLLAEPLVAAHEIVHLPSLSTVAVLRREGRSRDAPAGTIAVLADPVFGADDPRVGERVVAAPGAAAGPLAVLRGESEPPALSYRRLPHSRAEAAAILAMVPADRAFRALDFEASKQTMLSGSLADYRIVHLATHGVLDSKQPALSKVVLSLVDERGREIDGFLRAHEIYNLRLPAELVVLAGCETALGKEVRGEGLVGLARGFMYAGAARVMVSLWKVSDRGTADLMEVFYRNLLRRGMAPAAALRAAQLEVRARQPEPFHWAGFVIQGDWRGTISDE